jgi:hypothetical protein
VESLGRAVRGELGGFGTIGDALSAAGAAPLPGGFDAGPDEPAAAALRRAAQLRSEALGGSAC